MMFAWAFPGCCMTDRGSLKAKSFGGTGFANRMYRGFGPSQHQVEVSDLHLGSFPTTQDVHIELRADRDQRFKSQAQAFSMNTPRGDSDIRFMETFVVEVRTTDAPVTLTVCGNS